MDQIKICRLCLKAATDLKLIFNEQNAVSDIEGLLSILFQIKIKPDNTKSKNICVECINKLQEFYKFYNQILVNEEYWEQISKQETKEGITTVKGGDFEFVSQIKLEIEIDPENVLESTSLESDPNCTIEYSSDESRKCKKSRKAESKFSKKASISEEDNKIRNFYDLSCHECTPNPVFETFLAYKLHKRNTHSERRPFVRCCNRKLSERCKLLQHLAFHFTPEQFRCKVCDKLYADKNSLAIHLAQQHGDDETKIYGCDHCGKRFIKFDYLKVHLRTHLNEEERKKLRTFSCSECSGTFISERVLKAHMKDTHLKAGLYCELCGKRYRRKLDYELHKRNVHSEEGPERVQCEICSKWFSHSKNLRLHIRSIHERTSGPIICQICGMETTTKPALRNHIQMKHTERAFKCEFCDKAFQTSLKLKEHLPIHTGVSLYNCMYCEKDFNNSSNMYKHLKANHAVEWTRDKAEKNMDPRKWKAKNS